MGFNLGRASLFHPDPSGAGTHARIEIIRIDIFSKQATCIRRYSEYDPSCLVE